MIWPQDKLIGATLQRDLDEARAAIPVLEPDPIDLTFEDGGYPRIERLEGASWVYIFEDRSGDHHRTHSLAKDERDERNPNKLPQLNDPSPILYVGSSTGGRINSRLREHLRAKPTSTYALSLGLWFRCDVRLHLRNYDVSAGALQILEDSFADALRPALGKRGSNGR